MKRNCTIYIVTAWAAAVVGLSSCKKDSLLNQTPLTALSDASYWNTVSDLRNYINNLYSNGNIFPLFIGDFSGGYYTADANSDNLVPLGHSTRLNGEYTLAGNGGYADWTDIRDVNYFLANYHRVKSSWSDISMYVGESYFFRAMLYFNGLKSYGALPWVSKPLNVNDSAELYSSRLPRNIVVDSIVTDLDSAIADLPVKSSASSMRLYREYAQAFKARVCLYEGTWEKYHQTDDFGVPGQDGSAFLQKAAAAASDVMASGTFSLDNIGLYHGYWSLFNQTDYSASKEVIFWGASIGGANGNNDWQNIFQGGSYRTFNMGLSKSLVDDYLCTDGNPTSVSPLYKGDDSLNLVAANRDPRLSQVMFLAGDTVTYSAASSATVFTNPAILASDGSCPTGYQLYKGLNVDPFQNPNTPSPVHNTDGVIYMRYPEVLLIYAEAKAELGTITQSDVDATINKLRDRVGMAHLNLGSIPSDPKWIFPALSPVINEVRRERRVELACEGFRFDDICRWAAAGILISGWKPLGAPVHQFLTVNFATSGSSYLVVGSNIYVNGQGYIEPYQKTATLSSGYNFNLKRDYLLPIDQQNLNLNSKLTQNPGW